MTDIQAALGANQIKRLHSFIAQRHEKAWRYNELLQGQELVLPTIEIDGRSSLHLYVVQLPETICRLSVFEKREKQA